MSEQYQRVFHKELNWENPKDLIEKIDWLQLYSDTSLWTLCADKYMVRQYISSVLGGGISCLNELYGKWDVVEDIDWDSLPQQFVLKTNHGCGEVIIVKDKSKLDKERTNKRLNEWMQEKYGMYNGQIHYTHIKPCVIAERLLCNPIDSNASLIDYKLWCFGGKPEFFLVAFDRKNGNHKLSAFDLSWNNISERVLNKNTESYSGIDIDCPTSKDEMIDIAKSLSKNFPEVRVDFYDNNGRAIFGELTFTTGFGNYKYDFYQYLGSRIDLTKIHKLRKPNRIG